MYVGTDYCLLYSRPRHLEIYDLRRVLEHACNVEGIQRFEWFLCCRMNLGSGNASVTHTLFASDGQWHTVMFRRWEYELPGTDHCYVDTAGSDVRVFIEWCRQAGDTDRAGTDPDGGMSGPLLPQLSLLSFSPFSLPYPTWHKSLFFPTQVVVSLWPLKLPLGRCWGSSRVVCCARYSFLVCTAGSVHMASSDSPFP